MSVCCQPICIIENVYRNKYMPFIFFVYAIIKCIIIEIVWHNMKNKWLHTYYQFVNCRTECDICQRKLYNVPTI